MGKTFGSRRQRFNQKTSCSGSDETSRKYESKHIIRQKLKEITLFVDFFVEWS